jgi:hypothetical protein
LDLFNSSAGRWELRIMAAQRESSAEDSEWAGISESGDDDMDFEVSV